MDLELWEPILRTLGATFPKLRRVSCYATAINLLAKSQQELERLRALGLKLLYIGPESGDDATLKRIAKGARRGCTIARPCQYMLLWIEPLTPNAGGGWP